MGQHGTMNSSTDEIFIVFDHRRQHFGLVQLFRVWSAFWRSRVVILPHEIKNGNDIDVDLYLGELYI